jgi:hypothetical protein
MARRWPLIRDNSPEPARKKRCKHIAAAREHLMDYFLSFMATTETAHHYGHEYPKKSL